MHAQLIRKKPEVSFEDFEKELDEYAKNAKKLPKLKSFVINVVREGYGIEEKPVDCVAEFEFPDENSFTAAFESPEAKSLLEGLERVAEKTEFVYAEERVLKKPRAAAKPKAKKKAKKAKKTAKKKAKKKAKKTKAKKKTAKKKSSKKKRKR